MGGSGAPSGTDGSRTLPWTPGPLTPCSPRQMTAVWFLQTPSLRGDTLTFEVTAGCCAGKRLRNTIFHKEPRCVNCVSPLLQTLSAANLKEPGRMR